MLSAFFSNRYKGLFILISFFLLFFLPYLSFDFGITGDEPIHHKHGKVVLAFYEGKNKAAQVSPFDSLGNVPMTYNDKEDSVNEYVLGEMTLVGGFFDFASAFAIKYLSPFGIYETRHIVNSLFGWTAIVFTGLLVWLVAGWRPAFFALLLMACSPRFIGHSMNNPTDIPFAGIYTLSLFFILKFLKELPRPKIFTCVALIFGIAISIDIRIAGLILIPFLLLFTFCKEILQLNFNEIKREDFHKMLRPGIFSLIVGVCAYFAAALFWPYAMTDPFKVPIISLKVISDYKWNTAELFEGKWLNYFEIPWYYIPKWFFLNTPLFIPFGFILLPLSFFKKFSSINKVQILMIAFTFIFPIFYSIINKTNGSYHEVRHYMFCYPPMVACCALAFENLFRNRVFRFSGFLLAAILVIFILEPLWWMKKNHPNEVTYFTPLIGGVDGAFKKYDTEYYSQVVRQGVEWVQDNIPPGTEEYPVRIRVWFASVACSDYYIRKKPGYRFVNTYEISTAWDYSLLEIAAAKGQRFRKCLEYWPPAGTIHEIKADNTPLLAIIKNPWKETNDEIIKQAVSQAFLSANNMYSIGYFYYKRGEPVEAINWYQKAIEEYPRFSEAYNNLGIVYGSLFLFDEQIRCCQLALQYSQDMYVAKNNIAEAISLKKNKETLLGLKSEKELINLSVQLHNIGKFDECIQVCEKIIKKNPNNELAYNNICSSYNSLGKYQLAIEACKKALAVNPDFPRARGNLKNAINQMERGETK